MSTNVEELLEAPSCRRPSSGDIAGDFVLVEHAPDGRQESRKLFGELGVVLSHRSKRDELFADQVVESALRAKAALDPLCRSALLLPDLLKPHAETIALETCGVQSFKIGDGSSETPPPDVATPASQTSRTFLARPARTLVSIDFFAVATPTVSHPVWGHRTP